MFHAIVPKVEGRPIRIGCDCLQLQGNENAKWPALRFHNETQDTECEAWKELQSAIEKAVLEKWEKFEPVSILGWEKYSQITTLPRTIANLKSVKILSLYGSNLVRIPPEIGEMTNLEEFDPYTSYRLHWFPYEITRCKNLKRSRVSTRALYGNYKYRPPFPRLPQNASPTAETVVAHCSVCRSPLAEDSLLQVWISLRVATDVLPLLVHACSQKCIESLPAPAPQHIPVPHRGGIQIQQPKRE